MILELKLTLLDTEPPIWRRILVEDDRTLHQLHRMIQILMGWWDYHLYEFEVKDRKYHEPGDEPFYDEDIGEEATDFMLRDLSLKKDETFGYVYDFGDDWRIEILVERRRREPRGRSWILPWLLEGERAGPPEDCGGVDGLREILDAIDASPRDAGSDDAADPFGEEERQRLLEWLGGYDPAAFDRRTVNHFLVMAAAWGALRG
jgi:Plasmid pRiA4b ORF-3-like protein